MFVELRDYRLLMLCYYLLCKYVADLLVNSWFGVSDLPQWRVVLVGPQCLPLGSAYQGGGDVR